MTDTSQDFTALLGEPESLHEDLEDYVEEIAVGKWVKHPLVFASLIHPDYCQHINGMYKQKLAAVEKAEGEGDWEKIVLYLTERPYRLNALREYEHELEDNEFWRIVGAIWIDSENIWQMHEMWEDVFSSFDSKCRKWIMDDGEKLFYDKMPDELTIYRGYHTDGRADGLSWTLNRERADFFAHYMLIGKGEPRIVEAKVSKSNVLAFFNGRHEDEIVVLNPDLVTDKKEVSVGQRTDGFF